MRNRIHNHREALRAAGTSARAQDLSPEAVARVQRDAAVLLAARRTAGAASPAARPALTWRPVLAAAAAVAVAVGTILWLRAPAPASLVVHPPASASDVYELDAKLAAGTAAANAALQDAQRRYRRGSVVPAPDSAAALQAGLAGRTAGVREELAGLAD